MFLPNSSPIMTKQNIEVLACGENVIIKVGNAELTMHYEQAFDISIWIREEGRIVKSVTGRGRSIRSLGRVSNLDEKLKPLPYQDGTAIHVKPKLNKWTRDDVTSEGRMVLIKVGNTTMKLYFENALKIAQWIRLRAKEARNRSGDTRHWSEISKQEFTAGQ